jgi:hypothetical protein
VRLIVALQIEALPGQREQRARRRIGRVRRAAQGLARGVAVGFGQGDAAQERARAGLWCVGAGLVEQLDHRRGLAALIEGAQRPEHLGATRQPRRPRCAASAPRPGHQHSAQVRHAAQRCHLGGVEGDDLIEARQAHRHSRIERPAVWSGEADRGPEAAVHVTEPQQHRRGATR